MSSKKWLLANGQVYKLYEDNLSLRQALELAAVLSVDRHLLIKNEFSTSWAVYWRHRKQTLACPLPDMPNI
ncbi:MAG: hypothetical protein ACFFEJ_03920 [Candidatus Thorarchaeota archaeon]